jgi:D-sedoheptulose 7-phosphate isomerase
MTDFLYPFIEAEPPDPAALLADLARSADAKAAQSEQLRTETLEREGPAIAAAAGAVADRLGAGGRLHTFGNGGSATDAAGLAALFSTPPRGRPLPARSLAEDPAVITALGNDVGIDLVFSRQLIAQARPGDVALGISTSGTSRNVLAALEEAHRRGLCTVALAGYEGGDVIGSAAVDHPLVVRSDSVHRIQEVQAAVAFALWEAVQARLQGAEAGA